MITKNQKILTVLKLACTLVLGIAAFQIFLEMQILFQPIFEKAHLLSKSALIRGMGAVLVSACFMLILLAVVWLPRFRNFLLMLRPKMGWVGSATGVVYLVLLCWLLIYSRWSDEFGQVWMRSFLLAFGFLLSGVGFCRSSRYLLTLESFLGGALCFGSIFVLAHEMQCAVSYPFSWTWSEGNRLWDYSLLYGRSRYIYPADQPIFSLTDAGRQSLWGLPFLFPHISIQAVRAWDALMFTLPYLIFGLLNFRQKGQKALPWVLAGLWTMLFLHTAPVYSTLIVVAILVLFTRRMKLLPGCLILILAGYYAYISRYTWMFTAGFWGALLAFLEADNLLIQNTRQRWIRSVAFGLAGVFGGFLLAKILPYFPGISAVFPQTHAGVGENGFNISAIADLIGRQPLLWDLLWPNTTNRQGIVLSLALLALPFSLLILTISHSLPWKLNGWQKLLLWTELLAFFAVGVIVSVKIGGGSNLHNLDMFLITLLLIAGLVWRAGGKKFVFFDPLQKTDWWIAGLLILMVLYPSTRGMMSAGRLVLPDAQKVNEALGDIQKMVDETLPKEILFMDQRQLLTFEYIKNVPLVPEYEKKLLMDMAMADNQEYFQKFYQDLHNQRFGLIVTEPLFVNFQGSQHQAGFGRENDAWVIWVSLPLKCSYETVLYNPQIGFELLAPRQGEIPHELKPYCSP